MARHVLTDVGIWIDGLDFAGVSNSVGIEMAADTPEDTVFASGEWKSFAEGGLKTDTLTLEGFYDTTGPDADIFDSLGKEESAMVVPDGQVPGRRRSHRAHRGFGVYAAIRVGRRSGGHLLRRTGR